MRASTFSLQRIVDREQAKTRETTLRGTSPSHGKVQLTETQQEIRDSERHERLPRRIFRPEVD